MAAAEDEVRSGRREEEEDQLLQNTPFILQNPLIWIAAINRDPIIFRNPPTFFKIPPNLDRDP
jgi:hypothetical protein